MSNLLKPFVIWFLVAIFCSQTVMCKIRIINLSDNITSSSESARNSSATVGKITIGILLPSQRHNIDDGPGKMSSLESVLPSVLLAVESISSSYHSLDWDILIGDTQCNSTIGPLTAVEMVYRYKPNLFLGPVCPYVLSPVSRFSTIWGIPVFTTSGMNSAFRDKTSEHRFLTCLAGDYFQLGIFVTKLLGIDI